MPITSCGFLDTPNASGDQLLAQYGPTVPVLVGFDPLFRAGTGMDPSLPSDRILAVVDTGAAISCIDTGRVERLNLPLVGMEDFAGIAGSSRRPMHLAQITIPDLGFYIYGEFAAVDLIAGGQPHEVLLGRSFLRAFRMIYDGRTGEVIIENDSSAQ